MVLSAVELKRVAKALGLTSAQFKTRYDVTWEPELSRFCLDAPRGCPLLSSEGCRVHEVKPIQCRTFPFWPELVSAPREMRSRCEGVGHPDGEVFSVARIKKLTRGIGTA